MGWFKERTDVLGDAFGVRRFVIIGATLLVVRFVGWLNDKLAERGITALLEIPEWTIWVMVLLAFSGYFLLEYVVRLSRNLSPKLAVSFVPNGGCIVTSPNKEYAG